MAGHWWSVAPAQTETTPISGRRGYVEVLAVWGVFFAASTIAAGFSLAGHDPSGTTGSWTKAVPTTVDQFATLTLCVVVPAVLVARRGPQPPRLGLSREGVGAGQLVRILAWALLALILGSIATRALATGSFPAGSFSYPNLVVNVAHALQAGPIEEIVVLAFCVTTLEQARRPRAEIVVVALVLRCSYHIYYGPGVVGIVVWAAVFLWLYLRFRTVLPLIVLHSAWDTFIFLGNRWHPILGVVGLTYLGLLIAAPITWLVARGQRRPAQPAWRQGSPPWAAPTWPPGAPWAPGSEAARPPEASWGSPAPSEEGRGEDRGR